MLLRACVFLWQHMLVSSVVDIKWTFRSRGECEIIVAANMLLPRLAEVDSIDDAHEIIQISQRAGR